VVGDDARADRQAVPPLIASWWFPETDGGVVVQVVVTLIIAIAIGVAVRKERSLVLLVIGVTLVTLGWYGIRGLH
jgi:hypothetical protein